MINFFRSFFQSKIGLGLTIGFLVLIAIAFAAGDVGNSGSFGGLSGTNSVAVVGDEDVTTAELRQSADNAFRQVQQDEPTLSMAEFVEDGGLMQVLDTLLDRVAVSEFGKMLGVRAGENLINSDLLAENTNGRPVRSDFKGMTPEQRAAILEEQAQQREAARQRKLQEAEAAKQQDMQEAMMTRMAMTLDRQRDRERREAAKQLGEERKRQASEARDRKKELDGVYANAVGEEYFVYGKCL